MSSMFIQNISFIKEKSLQSLKTESSGISDNIQDSAHSWGTFAACHFPPCPFTLSV